MPRDSAKTIYVKGLWHQGLVAASVWANQGFKVVGLCDSTEEINSLNRGDLPIFEPGLSDLFMAALQRENLTFTLQKADLPPPDFLSFMHDTEVDEFDQVNLEMFLRDFNSLHCLMLHTNQILVTAQLPPGTCESLLEEFRNEHGFEPSMAYMPENLRLGAAIERFENPPLPVFGMNLENNIENFMGLFPRVLSFQSCSLTEAEILKSALNVFLAISITFGNEISEICDQFSANGFEVMKLLKTEPRIGNQLPLLPGMPFSGGTLGRDVQNLQRFSTSGNQSLIQTIWKSNEHRGKYLISTICDIAKTNQLKRVGLLGLTYKPETSTLRRSFPLEVFWGIKSSFDVVTGYDPMYLDFKEEAPIDLVIVEDLDRIYLESDLLVLTTPWVGILEYLHTRGIKDKVLIDPFGAFKDIFKDEPSYYHFGGLRRNN
jgi:UDPglucose 6-dehydrogenase